MIRPLVALLLSSLPVRAFAQVVEPLPALVWSGPAAAPLPLEEAPSLSQLSGLGGLELESLPLPPALQPLSAAPIEPARRSSDPDFDSFALEAYRRLGSPKLIEKKGPGSETQRMPGDGELSGDVERMPSENALRAQKVKELFEGEAASVREQEIGRGQKNFIVVKPGKTDRVLVIGGHYDKVHEGQGTIDNATGVMMVVQLYRLLKDVPTDHTLVFIGFGREEEGLLGSDRYVSSLSGEERGRIDAMINLDTLGVDGTFSWKNNSDKALLSAVREVAREGGYDLTERRLTDGDADSSSFRRAGVKAITIFGASPEVIFEIIHSENDNFASFSLPHYKNAFLLTGALVRRLDAAGAP